jgi:hypothetical protein
MLGDLGVSTVRLIKTMAQFLFSFEHQTGHAVRFNARGLLYECIFDALLFSRRTDLSGNLFPITSLLDLLSLFLFWIIIPAILPATMLGYYSVSASSMPSDFFHRRFNLLEAYFL